MSITILPTTMSSENSRLSQPEKTIKNETTLDLTQAKKAQNSAIVHSQMEVSLKTGNKSLALLYKTALSAINEALDPTLKTEPVKLAYDNQIDVSPEATADRIVSLATGFFNAFQQQNTSLTQKESLDTFMSIIRGGIDQGFSDARDILESLSVLDGNIATDIDSTYELVQVGLKDFVENTLNKEDLLTN